MPDNKWKVKTSIVLDHDALFQIVKKAIQEATGKEVANMEHDGESVIVNMTEEVWDKNKGE